MRAPACPGPSLLSRPALATSPAECALRHGTHGFSLLPGSLQRRCPRERVMLRTLGTMAPWSSRRPTARSLTESSNPYWSGGKPGAVHSPRVGGGVEWFVVSKLLTDRSGRAIWFIDSTSRSRRSGHRATTGRPADLHRQACLATRIQTRCAALSRPVESPWQRIAGCPCSRRTC